MNRYPLFEKDPVNPPLRVMSLYFAALPTVQSEEHSKIFADTMRKELKPMGLDYDELIKPIKSGLIVKDFPITGFLWMKEGDLDTEILKEFQKKVLMAYENVLESKPMKCPVRLFIDWIMGPRTVEEYHSFKNHGFDVPLSGQKAFFTIMNEYRVPVE